MITNTDNTNSLIERLETTEYIPWEPFTDGWNNDPVVAQLRKQAARAAKSHGGFNMANTFFACGAPSCLTGHAWDLSGNPGKLEPGDTAKGIVFLADWLGCSRKEAAGLYYGRFTFDPAKGVRKLLGEITPAEAVQALREMMA